MDADFVQLWNAMNDEQRAAICDKIKATSKVNTLRRDVFAHTVVPASEVFELMARLSYAMVHS